MPYVTDDGGPLWSKDENGAYWLLFPNKHALTQDEIKSIFSQFGTVQMLTMAGDEKGFRFIKYALLEEVERAAENLQNHPTVRLLPYRPKTKNNKSSNDSLKIGQNNNNTNNHQSAMDNVARNLYQRKPARSKNEQTISSESQFQNSMYNGESMSAHERKDEDIWSNNDNGSVHSISSNKSGSIPHSPKSTLIHQTSCTYTNSTGSASPPNLIQSNRVKHLLKLRGLNANSFSINGLHNNSNVIDDDEIPELVTKRKLNLHKQSRKLILNAEEVVVANVHTDYGSAYILHLFEQYDPLAISYMKEILNSKLRYCHVYFKTAQDALEVEIEFDRYNLSGKNLIVMRPCRLMEEAMS